MGRDLCESQLSPFCVCPRLPAVPCLVTIAQQHTVTIRQLIHQGSHPALLLHRQFAPPSQSYPFPLLCSRSSCKWDLRIVASTFGQGTQNKNTTHTSFKLVVFFALLSGFQTCLQIFQHKSLAMCSSSCTTKTTIVKKPTTIVKGLGIISTHLCLNC